jgi:hypothetical protein
MKITNEYADLNTQGQDLDHIIRELFRTKGAMTLGHHNYGPGVAALLSPDGEVMNIIPPIPKEELELLRQGAHILKAEPNLEGEELETNIIVYIAFWCDWYAEGRGGALYMEPTFTLLEQRYGRPTFGGQDLSYSETDNVVLWTGISQALGQAIINLTAKRAIHWHPTTAIQYDLQGRMLPLPLASLPIDREYTTPHWLPVTFRLGPNCGDHFCPNREQWLREQK